jgi:hypothetical protein
MSAITYYTTAQLSRIYNLPKDRLYDAKNKGLLVADACIGHIDCFSPFRLEQHLASLASCRTAQEYAEGPCSR